MLMPSPPVRVGSLRALALLVFFFVFFFFSGSKTFLSTFRVAACTEGLNFDIRLASEVTGNAFSVHSVFTQQVTDRYYSVPTAVLDARDTIAMNKAIPDPLGCLQSRGESILDISRLIFC